MSTDTKREPWLVEAGSRFTTLRRAQSLSIRELSRLSGVARQTITKLEKGIAFPGSLVRLALGEALGVENLGRVLMEER
ncbi:helix-turn-helix transcriptional regulator [bacterium]|nr:helix-turn-helix transcriptional regulator [bacterium]